MRVLQLSSLWPPVVLGGAEVYASGLTDALRSGGHEVGVVTLGVDGADVVEQSPAWPYPLQSWAGQPHWKRAAFHARDQLDPVSERAVRRAIRRFRPDVVHSHSVAGMSALVLRAPGVEGVAHVRTLHDYWLLCQRATLVDRHDVACDVRCTGCRLVSAARSRLLERHPPDIVLAVSEAVAAEHRAAGWFDDGRLRVLPNPVDRSVAHADRARLENGPITFGYLGQLLAIKGVRTLLDAFRRLPQGTAELVVAGRGALAPEVTGDGITPLGWIDDAGKDAFFARIDALVVPSEWKDPAPLVVGEALVRGVPVIGAAIGGIPELVGPDFAALTFPPGDVEALRARLALFAADPDAHRVRTPPAAPGWDEHTERVVAAYGDAMAVRREADRR